MSPSRTTIPSIMILCLGILAAPILSQPAQTPAQAPVQTKPLTVAQPLANLAAYLLEPESDDGLIVWDYFDKDLASGGFGGGPAGFPVYKLMKPALLVKETIR